MQQLTDFSDDRLVNGCIYCGGKAETRDHVPSRILMDSPYPENLPVVGACRSCNQGFSKDEQYFVCLLGAALAGSSDPDRIKRSSVARAMRRSPRLRARIEASKRRVNGKIEFAGEEDRIRNVILKQARGHAAYELSQICRRDPDFFWCGPLILLSQEELFSFNAPHIQEMLGEVGSRGLQRALVVEMISQSASGDKNSDGFLMNDWIEVQEGYYRYIAIDDMGGIIIRIVIEEYLGCEIIWKSDLGLNDVI